MKAITVAALLLVNATASLFAQGLVNFYNDATTPVSVQAPVYLGDLSIMSGPRDSYYFGLLLYDRNLGRVTFTGVYGTNTGVNGLFGGGTVAVPGWIPGTTTNFFIAGWSADLGHDFSYLFPGLTPTTSVYGLAYAVGISGNGSTMPPLDLVGPLQNGPLYLRNSLVPEPSSTALIAIGAGVSLLCHRRWWHDLKMK